MNGQTERKLILLCAQVALLKLPISIAKVWRLNIGTKGLYNKQANPVG
jgi:hypothetical protein